MRDSTIHIIKIDRRITIAQNNPKSCCMGDSMLGECIDEETMRTGDGGVSEQSWIHRQGHQHKVILTTLLL